MEPLTVIIVAVVAFILGIILSDKIHSLTTTVKADLLTAISSVHTRLDAVEATLKTKVDAVKTEVKTVENAVK